MDIISDIESPIEFQPLTLGVAIAAVLAAFLLLVSGFASGSEIAFFSLSPNDINDLSHEKNNADI